MKTCFSAKPDGNIYVKLNNNIVSTNAYEQQDSLKENLSYFRIT